MWAPHISQVAPGLVRLGQSALMASFQSSKTTVGAVALDQPHHVVLPRAITLGAGDPKHLQPPPQVAERDRAGSALVAGKRGRRRCLVTHSAGSYIGIYGCVLRSLQAA